MALIVPFPSVSVVAANLALRRTDGEGGFQIAVPDRWLERLVNQWDIHAVCAWKDGMQLVVRPFPQRSVPPAGSVRLVLLPAEKFELSVQDPAERPAAGIRVLVSTLARENELIPLPDEHAPGFQ